MKQVDYTVTFEGQKDDKTFRQVFEDNEIILRKHEQVAAEILQHGYVVKRGPGSAIMFSPRLIVSVSWRMQNA